MDDLGNVGILLGANLLKGRSYNFVYHISLLHQIKYF